MSLTLFLVNGEQVDSSGNLTQLNYKPSYCLSPSLLLNMLLTNVLAEYNVYNPLKKISFLLNIFDIMLCKFKVYTLFDSVIYCNMIAFVAVFVTLHNSSTILLSIKRNLFIFYPRL